MNETLRIGSLFSGIGGLELGLEWAGIGHTVWQCESDPFAREVLARHWPGVPCYEDVRSLPSTLAPVDIICGGFPCQDVSLAGKRAGMSGARSGLWSYMAQAIEGVRPEWVVVENVAHGARRWVDTVRSDLDGLGYASLPVQLEARFLGLPHTRRRVFLLAHAYGFELREHEQRMPGGWTREVRHGGQEELALDGAGEWRTPSGGLRGESYGVPRGMDAHRCLGNAVVPQCAQVIGEIIRELSSVR